jgi:hypothetical protein
MSLHYENLIVVEQTATELVLRRGESERPNKAYGIKFDLVVLLLITIVLGLWTTQHQRYFPNDTNVIWYWSPVILTLLSLIYGIVSHLNSIAYEIWTFDRSAKVLRYQGYSRLGQRRKLQALENFVEAELVEHTDEDCQYCGINLLMQKRKKFFLGWSNVYSGKHAAINRHHYRQVTMQVRDFLWTEREGQPILDQTVGEGLDLPLSVIEEERKVASIALKEFGGFLFSGKVKRQAHIDNLHQMLLRSPDNADLNWKLAMALSMSRTTQLDAIPYLQRAKQLYIREGGMANDRVALIDRSLKQLEQDKEKRKQL